MPTYAAGATVERRYPGPDADAARRAAEPQVQSFLGSGWMIRGERWEADSDHGAPIGDAIATGTISYLAGSGGELVITYVAATDTEVPASLPSYTLTDPRKENLQTIATARVVVGVIGVVIFVIFFLNVASQMGRMNQGFDFPGPTTIHGEEWPSP
jgi:hypothetical protein